MPCVTASPAAQPAAAPALSASAVPLADAPAVAAARVRALLPPPPRPGPSRRVQRWGLIGLLLAAGLATVMIDGRAGFPGGAFAWLVPFTWLGVIVVLSATHAHPPRRADWLRGFGCMTVLASVFALFLLALLSAVVSPYLSGRSDSRSGALWVVGTLLTLVVGGLLARATHASGHAPPDRQPRLKGAADLIEALADDVAPGKPAAGFIDVGGHEQPSKLVRSGKSATGWEVSLYRDEWLRLRLPLRDGNRLRVSLVDRVKQRAGRWKRGRSGKSKWKTGRADWLSTLELQLVVNPAVYRVKPAEGGDAVQLTQRPGGGPMLSLAKPVAARAFDPEDVLRSVAALYGRLERLGSRSV